MKNTLFTCLLFALSFLIEGCSKDTAITHDSTKLSQALHAKDTEALIRKIQPLLTTYTQSTLQQLAARINSTYAVTATLLCFDCIQTNPAQTEMRISYRYNGIAETRILDLTPGPSNSMRIVAIHE